MLDIKDCDRVESFIVERVNASDTQRLTNTVESKEIIYWPITFTVNVKRKICNQGQSLISEFYSDQVPQWSPPNPPASMGILTHHEMPPPPPRSLKKAGTRLDWVSLLRGETPALLRQWLLKSPASNLRSRRIHTGQMGARLTFAGQHHRTLTWTSDLSLLIHSWTASKSSQRAQYYKLYYCILLINSVAH